MNIKWESNSRAKALAAQGKIKDEDIIPRTKTENFPAGACTVRMTRPQWKTPVVTLHIRGKLKKKTNTYNNFSWEWAETCRVNFGGHKDKTMNSNGVLDEDYTWQDVHNLVEEVKEKMEL